MTKDELDKATGELIIAIGNGTFRDAVAMLVGRVAREAYIHGTDSAQSAKNDAIERRWKEFDAKLKEVSVGNLSWRDVVLVAQQIRNLTIQ